MCCQKLSERGTNFWGFILVNYPSISLFFLFIILKIKNNSIDFCDKTAHIDIPNYISNNDLVVHHLDYNPKNNELSNLKVLTKSEHAKLHEDYKIGLAKGNKTMSENPIAIKNRKEKNSEMFKQLNSRQALMKCFIILSDIENDNNKLTEENYELYRNKKDENEKFFIFFCILKRIRPKLPKPLAIIKI